MIAFEFRFLTTRRIISSSLSYFLYLPIFGTALECKSSVIIALKLKNDT